MFPSEQRGGFLKERNRSLPQDMEIFVKKSHETFLHTQTEFFDTIFLKPTLLIEICRFRGFFNGMGSKMVSKSLCKHTDPVSKLWKFPKFLQKSQKST